MSILRGNQYSNFPSTFIFLFFLFTHNTKDNTKIIIIIIVITMLQCEWNTIIKWRMIRISKRKFNFILWLGLWEDKVITQSVINRYRKIWIWMIGRFKIIVIQIREYQQHQQTRMKMNDAAPQSNHERTKWNHHRLHFCYFTTSNLNNCVW